MCGRYASSRPPEFLARLFHTVNRLPNFAPSWNIAPSQEAMVVRRHPDTGERHLDLLKWLCCRASRKTRPMPSD
jgi:putative SOS response-associated peptidase YedK